MRIFQASIVPLDTEKPDGTLKESHRGVAQLATEPASGRRSPERSEGVGRLVRDIEA